jgi:maltose alpha-D-glucosyltransferase/alpha-amylase
LPKTPATIYETSIAKVPDDLMQVADSLFFEMIALLGQRTGELHVALASDREDPNLAPEAFNKLYQRSAYQSLRSLVRRTIGKVRRVKRRLADHQAARADEFIESEKQMLDYLAHITDHIVKAEKIRIHGDYHLGQVLFTGRDFKIIDLEGEPARTLSERRLKFSAFRDVAGMIRSFHYAVSSRFLQRKELRAEDAEVLEPWIEPWFTYVAGTFLEAYRRTVDGASFVPDDPADVEMLTNLFMLEKAVYEVGYEIDNRPDWLMIPLRGVSFVLGDLEEAK